MKKITIISAIALSGLFYNAANAQIRIGLGLNINTPNVRVIAQTPVYAGYNNADDYYYLPDVDAYYCVPEQCYYYNNGANWVSAAYLPGEYRNYDWRYVRRYEVRARRPYLNADVYRERYRGNVGNWARYNERYTDDRNYANRDFNRDDRRNNDLRFERRNDNYRGAEHAENRGWDNANRRDDRFDNRRNYNQSYREQGNYDQQDRGHGDYNQPSRQRGNDQQRGDDSNEHFASNHGQNSHDRSGD